MTTRFFARSVVGLLILAGGCAPAATTAAAPAMQAAPATAALDRSIVPPPTAAPSVDFPAVQRYTLSNGLNVWQVEKTGLPLVNIQLVFNAGAIAEPADQPGLASLTAAMLTMGTTTRTATQIADEIEFLAVGLSAGAGRETGAVSLSTLTRNLEPALDVFADVVMNPAFSEQEWTRVKADRLAAISQSRDQAATLASEEFSRRIFGATHP
jgi:zinc protease